MSKCYSYIGPNEKGEMQLLRKVPSGNLHEIVLVVSSPARWLDEESKSFTAHCLDLLCDELNCEEGMEGG